MTISDHESGVESLVSGVLTSPADALLREAVLAALQVPLDQRADFLAVRLGEIQSFMESRPAERPWTFSEYAGTDGSRVFRGGYGHSLVVDPQGNLWRARSYEDFETAYDISANACTIAALTPVYTHMRQYTVELALTIARSVSA